MKNALIAVASLLAGATPALAQQPAVYPLRSQPAAQQSVDSAYCYWQAKRQTGVDMARQSQRPQRVDSVRFAAADGGRGASEPPLPAASSAPSGVSRTPKEAAPAAKAGEAPSGGDARLSAERANPASTSQGAGQLPGRASDARGPASASTAVPASASASASASAPASGSGVAGLPPLPPPLPPMATYWQAYGDCMQARGYGVK